MRLKDALFKNLSKAFRVTTDGENWEDFSEFDLESLSGATLAKDYALGPFEGTFVVTGMVVTKNGASQDCYLDVVLPERISEAGGAEIPKFGAVGAASLWFSRVRILTFTFSTADSN